MKKLLIGMGITAVIAGLVLVGILNSDDSQGGILNRGKGIEVSTEVVKTGDLSSAILVTGTVEEVTKKDMLALSSVEITGVLAKVGDEVALGDILYTLDTSSLEDELMQVTLNREVSALQLEKTQNITTTSNSAAMKVALDLAKLDLKSAENAYEIQLENLDKNKILFDEGIISSSEYESLREAADESARRVEAAKLNLARSESDLNQVYTANTSSNKSLEYDVAIQLKNIEIMDLNLTRLEKELVDSLESTRAPIAGLVTAVHVETGDVVMQNSPLFQIIDMKDLIVKANVREYDIPSMELGQNVTIFGDAVDKDRQVLGKVSYIAPVASNAVINGREATGIEIEIQITKGMEYLKPGFTMDCEVATQELKDVVIGSFNMYREDIDNNKVAFVVVDGLVEERQIELGITSDFESEIISGLNPGDVVVVNPSLALKDGSKVEIVDKGEEEGL